MANELNINEFGEIIRKEPATSGPVADIPTFEPPTPSQASEPDEPKMPGKDCEPSTESAPVIEAMDPKILKEIQKELMPEIYAEKNKVVDTVKENLGKEEAFDLEQ